MRKAILIVSSSILLGIAFASMFLFNPLVDVIEYYAPNTAFLVFVVSIAVSAVLGIAAMNKIGDK